MDKILEIHGLARINCPVYVLTFPPRGGFGPCLPSRGSVGGRKRDVERERSALVKLTVSPAEIWHPGIPLFFPVSVEHMVAPERRSSTPRSSIPALEPRWGVL